ncbi:hypothetical protein HYH02_014668 [Chlamydomonas schloesseri]|uniref:Uncharacterized protein n=1 Tax=Chlamydomonas schloesseri TaxID=2026947 RepID=A0A835SL59_9CHLO|nr:hypothetical protein HYH02_014668 [Chlamydomonas schloesseri]|eukprot:KAG2427022.1 hypothetical protein HYH02_014668 [Chlamydomonas schloesseri]
MSHVTTSSDPLSVEVAELLQRTDTMLSVSSAAGRTMSETGRSLAGAGTGPGSVSRGLGRTTSMRSSGGALGGGASAFGVSGGGDALSEAASRMRSSYDVARSKLSLFKKTASFKEPLSVNIPSSQPDAPTPRFSPLSPSRTGGGGGAAGSVALTDPSIERILDRSASMSLPSPHRPGGAASGGGAGRTYNSFAGLQDMVSMVDEMVATAPTSPRPLVGAFSGAGLGRAAGRVGAGVGVGGGGAPSPSIGGGASKGSGVGLSSDGLRSPGLGLRSFSRFGGAGGSASPSPRSPLRKSPVPAASPSARSGSSRRAQLQNLLGKDLAAPYEVVKFKTEVGAQGGRPPSNLAALAGNLEEKFDRVNRKLKNWELVETAASERFNNAMDAALDVLFARVNLAWPSSEGGAGAPTAPATSSAAAAAAAKPSSRAASASKAVRPRSAPRRSSGDADADVRVTVGHGRHHRSGGDRGGGRDRQQAARYHDPDMETPSTTTSSSISSRDHDADDNEEGWAEEEAEASSVSTESGSMSDTAELKDGDRRSGSKQRKAGSRQRQQRGSGSGAKAERRRARGAGGGAGGVRNPRAQANAQQYQPHPQQQQHLFASAHSGGTQPMYATTGNGYPHYPHHQGGMWPGAVGSPQFAYPYGGGSGGGGGSHSYPLPGSPPPPVGMGAGLHLQPPTSPRPPVGSLPLGMFGGGPLLTHMLGSPAQVPPPSGPAATAVTGPQQAQWHSTLSVPSDAAHLAPGVPAAYSHPQGVTGWPTQPQTLSSPPHFAAGAGGQAQSSPLPWGHPSPAMQVQAHVSSPWAAVPTAPHYVPASYATQLAATLVQPPQQQQQQLGPSLGAVSALGTMSFYAYPGHTAAPLGAPPSPHAYGAPGHYSATAQQRPHLQPAAASHLLSPGAWPITAQTPATPTDTYAYHVSPQSPTSHKPLASGPAFAPDQRMSYAQHLMYAYGR